MRPLIPVFTGTPPSGTATIEVPVASLTLTGYAPQVITDVTINVPAASLALTGYAPQVITDVTINVPAAALTLTGLAPTVQATGTQFINVPLATLTLTGIAPDVLTSGNKIIDIPAASLTLTGYAPTVQLSDNKIISIPAASLTLTGYAPLITGYSPQTVNVPAASLALTGYAPSIYVLDGRFERGSVDASQSSITGVGNSAVITMRARMQNNCEYNPGVYHWQNPVGRVTGVDGTTPKFRFTPYPSSWTSGYRGYPWNAGRKPMYSYDCRTWYRFDNVSVVTGSYIEFWNNSSFTGNTVYVNRERGWTVTQTGEWIETLASTYPSLISVPSTAASFTPVNTTSFPAQSYICAEYSTQTDELGYTVPSVPLYSFKISDSSYTNPKRAIVFFGGVHASEDMANWVLKAATEFILSSDPLALRIRSEYDIYVYPLLNAPGRYGGHYRSQWQEGSSGEDDLNRHFSTSPAPIETVSKPRTAVAADLTADGHTKVWFAPDFHGSVGSIYGFYDDGTSSITKLENAIESRLGQQLSDFGVSIAGFTNLYFRDSWSTAFYITYEIGEPTSPLSDSAVSTFGQSLVKAWSDLIANGDLGHTLGIPTATLSLTGYAPSVSTARYFVLSADAGNYVLSGKAAELLRKYTLSGNVSSYAYTGVAATLKADRKLGGSAGSYTYTGYAATLQKTGSYALDGSVGAFTYAGVEAALKPLRHSYPTSDNSSGDWEPSTGINLYATLDDGILPDTNDYIFTHEASTCSIRLGVVANPGTTSGIVLNYQARGDGTHDLIVRLKQGTTTVATRTHTDVPTDYTTYAMELTTEEAAAITDYSALDVELEAA